MLPEFPIFTKCSSCNTLFKITKKIVSEEERRMGTSRSKRKYPFVRFLAIDDYIRAIEDGLCNSKPRGSKQFNAEVLELRLLLWRAFNDRFRDYSSYVVRGVDAEAITDPRYLDNCRAILSEMPEEGARDSNLLTLAEIHRNLGEFDECVRLLGRIADKDRFKHYISTFMEQCAGKSTKTVEVAIPG